MLLGYSSRGKIFALLLALSSVNNNCGAMDRLKPVNTAVSDSQAPRIFISQKVKEAYKIWREYDGFGFFCRDDSVSSEWKKGYNNKLKIMAKDGGNLVPFPEFNENKFRGPSHSKGFIYPELKEKLCTKIYEDLKNVLKLQNINKLVFKRGKPLEYYSGDNKFNNLTLSANNNEIRNLLTKIIEYGQNTDGFKKILKDLNNFELTNVGVLIASDMVESFIRQAFNYTIKDEKLKFEDFEQIEIIHDPKAEWYPIRGIVPNKNVSVSEDMDRRFTNLKPLLEGWFCSAEPNK